MDSLESSLEGKKVLFVITKSNWGGAQAYVYALARNFAKKGAVVTVALGGTGSAGAPTGLLAERLQKDNIKIVLVKSFMRNISAIKELDVLGELQKIIRDKKPDILHLNSSKAGGIGALAGRLENVPKIIYTAHGWAHREPRSFLNKLAIRIASWGTILLSHKVIVVSTLDFQDAPVLFSRKKLKLVRNGILAFDLLPKESARLALTTNMAQMPTGLLAENKHALQEKIWLVMLAELHPNKGVDTAIQAMPHILTKHSEAILVVIGEGQERENLERLIEKLNLTQNVFLLGSISDARTYLKVADAFLMPSRKEGMPFALLEAGFSELPVVASNTGGIPEVIESGVTGLLFPPNKPTALSDSLLGLLANPEEAQTLARSLKNKIVSEFSAEKMFEETEAVYVS